MDEYTDRMKWLTRPMRALTDRDVQDALEDRKSALAAATTKMGQELCQMAVAKLEAELEGRKARA